MKMDLYQLFSVCTCINFDLAKFYNESLYLYFKPVMLLLSSSTLSSPINQNRESDVPMHVDKNIRTGGIVFPSVNILRF